jgi:CHAD domain-containing protein
MAETVAAAARRVLRRRMATFVDLARRAMRSGRDADLHRARIAGKRVRYNVEYFASQLGPERDTAIGLLTLIQDRLGAVADCAAFGRAYESLLRDIEPGDPRVAGLRTRIAECKARRADLLASVRSLWQGVEHSPYPDMLAASIAASFSTSKPV